MTQLEIDRAVAQVTGESVSEIQNRGFSVADPLNVAYDPEPSRRRPWTLDWDAMCVAEWPDD